MLLNFKDNITKVTIEFQEPDGTVTSEEFDIGPSCGFLREAYTYEQGRDGSDKVTAILHTFEIYWAERKDSNAIPARVS